VSVVVPTIRSAMPGRISTRVQDHSAPKTGRTPEDGLKSHYDKAIIAFMKKASITEAKNNLSALIDSVKGGSPVLIMDRGRPVARLEPVDHWRPDDDGRLARLVRDGAVRPARRVFPKTVLTTKPPRARSSGVRALLEDRQDSR